MRAILTLLLVGPLLGCPAYYCEQWASRTVYKQTCKRYSGGVCAYYTPEPTNETYCAKWMTDSSGERVSSAAANVDYSTMRAAGASTVADVPAAARTYLDGTLAPFVCSLARGDVDKLSEHGRVIDKGLNQAGLRRFDFETETFTGLFYVPQSNDGDSYGFRIGVRPIAYDREGLTWPITKSDLVHWLSSRGMEVVRFGSNYIYGVAGYIDGQRGKPTSYRFSFQSTYTGERLSGYDLFISWKTAADLERILCTTLPER